MSSELPPEDVVADWMKESQIDTYTQCILLTLVAYDARTSFVSVRVLA